MYPAALHKIPTQTVDSSQIFESLILQNQPKLIKKTTKFGTGTQSVIWKKFVPNRTKISSRDCRERHICLD